MTRIYTQRKYTTLQQFIQHKIRKEGNYYGTQEDMLQTQDRNDTNERRKAEMCLQELRMGMKKTEGENMIKEDYNMPAWMSFMMLVEEGNYTLNIARQTGYTYSHMHQLRDFLIREGLLNVNKEGRKKTITFTKRGKEVSTLLKRLRELLPEK